MPPQTLRELALATWVLFSGPRFPQPAAAAHQHTTSPVLPSTEHGSATEARVLVNALPYKGCSLVTQLWPRLKEAWPEALDISHFLKEIPATASSACLKGTQKLR